MTRKPNNEPDLLSKAGIAGETPTMARETRALPAIVEYTPLASKERWRVEKFELFAAEFGIDAPYDRNLTRFHEMISIYSRQWLIARRLFGIGPVLPPEDAQPADYEPLGRDGVCALLGLEPEHLQAELNAILAIWRQGESAVDVESSAPEKPNDKLRFEDDALREFGFPDSLFVVKYWNEARKEEVARPQEENRQEKLWFAGQVKGEWGKMLSEPMAGTIARKALMNMLYLRRMEFSMASLSPESPKFDKLQKTKDELEDRYQQQLIELQNMFPEMAIAGRVSFRAVISELVIGYREYKARKDTRLLDKIRTAAEMEVELRQSLQAPEARYRFGQTIYLIEAMHNLSDPDYRTQLRPTTLKKLDAAYREAVDRVRQVDNEPLPDLERGVMPGEGDEYPELMEVEG
jgi:hypothetical protein